MFSYHQRTLLWCSNYPLTLLSAPSRSKKIVEFKVE